MKNIYKISALLCASLFVFSACVEENLEQPYKPAEVGDEITFGARAGFEDADPATKTVYGDRYLDPDSKKWFHPINWLNGTDKVEIYSPQGGGINPSCYTVHTTTDATAQNHQSYAQLKRNNPSGSLQWGEGYTAVIDGKTVEGVHDFYAMYPSSDTFKESLDGTLKSGVRMNGTIVNGVIPDVQNHSGISSKSEEIGTGSDAKTVTHWVAAPNMDYAYMVARNVGHREAGRVSLSFYPIVTAVEIQLTFNKPEGDIGSGSVTTYADNISITDVMVESTNTITGGFTCDLSLWENRNAYPACQAISSGYANSIRVPVWREIKGENEGESTLEPIVLSDGGSLTFTVFLLPATDITNLKVSFSTNGGSGWLGKELPGIEIKKNLKNRIIDLALPVASETIQMNPGNWITQIEEQKPDLPVVGLSIPGTGGSFSFASTENGYYQQTNDMNIQAQWNIGIRAFELVCNRPQDPSKSLGESTINCNGNPVAGATVYSALKDLINRVATVKKDSAGNPIYDSNGNLVYENSEFAVAILTYQPVGGQDNPRNAYAFAQSLHKMLSTEDTEGAYGLSSYINNMVTFSSDLTLAQAKNKLMIVVRMNQEGETEVYDTTGDGSGATIEAANENFDDAMELLKDLPILVINGCGTAKDKWARRGYQVTTQDSEGNDIVNAAVNMVNYTSYSSQETFKPANEVEYYIKGSRSRLGEDSYPDYNSHVSIDEDKIDFTYTTNADDCWFQEWARVSPGGSDGFYKVPGSGYIIGVQPPYQWKESYNEKLGHVTKTFEDAINGTFQKENKVVINSLCGYFVNSQYNKSYITYGYSVYDGGNNGDIEALATRLNYDFYQYILTAGMEDKTGPTGIVLMDFVSDDPADGAAYYIPSVIIANNFK